MTAVVIGVGNRYRHDDGAGLIVAGKLDALALPGVRVVETDGEPTRLIDAWEGASVAVVVDAVRTGTAPVGTVHRVQEPLAWVGQRSASSHALGLGDAYALGHALERLPQRLVAFGIEAENFATGCGLSDAVAAAVDAVVAAVVAEVAKMSDVAKVSDVRGDSSCA